MVCLFCAQNKEITHLKRLRYFILNMKPAIVQEDGKPDSKRLSLREGVERLLAEVKEEGLEA